MMELGIVFLYRDGSSATEGFRRLSDRLASLGMVEERPLGDHGHRETVVVLGCPDGRNRDLKLLHIDTMISLGCPIDDLYTSPVRPFVELLRKTWLVSGAYIGYVDFEYFPGGSNKICLVEEGPNPAVKGAVRKNREYGAAVAGGGRPAFMPVQIVPGEERRRRFDPAIATIAGFNRANAFSAEFVARFGRGKMLQMARAEELGDGGILVVREESGP